ncbi:ATP-binding protein [Amphibiibacter pelophylacis]|uniref:ATP-binding protein n=1 Tax=Amphibiibacter pelophylacis TaxID=1799477 RepID=A0ACC6P1G5_9BURK
MPDHPFSPDVTEPHQAWAPLAARVGQLLDRVEHLLGAGAAATVDWSASTAFRCRAASGPWGSARLVLEPVGQVAPMALDALLEVDDQKERLRANTEQFVRGLPANHVLLTGARGTGKSSLIKAVLQHYAPRGLRLIEVDKEDLARLPEVMALVAGRPERFVVYCDDLSFDEGESGYKALKSALDGTISAQGDNVLIYATSNRRHLLPERFSDNLSTNRSDDGEIHPGEAIEEKISLSERFGLWLSFYPFSQDQYLAITGQWLRHLGASDEQVAQARPHALTWATQRGSRSGRVAQQFARDHMGRISLALGDPA